MRAIPLTAAMAAQIAQLQPQTAELIRTLCAIPAPTGQEERRAAFIADWLRAHELPAQIDEAGNVRCALGMETGGELVVVMAHMDTVFPDTTPMPMREESGRLYCPGVGDNTANLAAMLTLAAFLRAQGFAPKQGVVFVANVGEEGLGNLKGCRAVMADYGSRVGAFLALDGSCRSVCTRAVGSKRYALRARAQGGHSFADFGRPSAIATLCRVVSALYAQRVPDAPYNTTYNVGMIQGGTSVNAIAQHAEALYEIRSDDAHCMQAMTRQLERILHQHGHNQAALSCELLGSRPCSVPSGNPDMQRALEAACVDALTSCTGQKPRVSAGSTDCNVPLSMGIPAACFGVYIGEGEHTREEWIDLGSLSSGMQAAASVLLNWFEKRS